MNTLQRLYKKIFHFFDKLEDKVRGALSKNPIVYALVGGVGVILFWRGVWHTGDILEGKGGWLGVIFSGPGSLILSLFILLIVGLFVSVFVGDMIVMSGLRQEKKLVDKTEDEIKDEGESIKQIEALLLELQKDVSHIGSEQEKINSEMEDQEKLLQKMLDKKN